LITAEVDITELEATPEIVGAAPAALFTVTITPALVAELLDVSVAMARRV
jgi:hypothetical protein